MLIVVGSISFDFSVDGHVNMRLLVVPFLPSTVPNITQKKKRKQLAQ